MAPVSKKPTVSVDVKQHSATTGHRVDDDDDEVDA